MSSPKGVDENPEATVLIIPAGKVDQELQPGGCKKFQFPFKEQGEALKKVMEKENEKDMKDVIMKRKLSVLIISVVIVGTIIAIVKKLGEVISLETIFSIVETFYGFMIYFFIYLFIFVCLSWMVYMLAGCLYCCWYGADFEDDSVWSFASVTVPVSAESRPA